MTELILITTLISFNVVAYLTYRWLRELTRATLRLLAAVNELEQKQGETVKCTTE